ncbi:hypothetical protein NOR_06477 [Metarhizium rileyi]|uniref:Zn(2)-C6 fungal-type domain-containing protein n=1 Tax=Metarhizium rileyi (strain RCEF 4871) TaxID=1649241 RepID=A0A167AEB6_METRR|nr:hypothetical protein NOR_06477 [Metarhizium rileyi RCEF 4871]
MLSAWRYDADTKEVAVPRSYDPAKGRSSKIQACKTCRETRCDGDGHSACHRCRRKGVACEYTSCGRAKRSPRPSSRPAASSICKPRPRSGRKHSLLGAAACADYDSSDTLSDKTVSPVPWHTRSLDVFDADAGSALAGAPDELAIDPLLLQGVQDIVQPYAEFGLYLDDGFAGMGGADVDMQYLVAAGTGFDHGVQQGGAYHVPFATADDESLRQCGLRWLPNQLA